MTRGRIKVLVLLSTWNGERYLPAQIESLLTQVFDGDLEILVRDDGSSDGTIDYLRSLDDPRIRLVEGVNLGARGSFFALLRMAQREDADYVALCDQDDVWRPDKLARAMAMLGVERAGLYASSLDLVDENLRPIGNYAHPGDRSFLATLLGNYVTGCTCVANRLFLQRLCFPCDESQVVMHDWWLASVATLEDHVVYDPVSSIQYRQHATNHIGIRTGAAKAVAKLRVLLRATPRITRFDHARQFLASAGDRMSSAKRDTLLAFLQTERSRLQRLQFVFGHRPKIDASRMLLFVLFG